MAAQSAPRTHFSPPAPGTGWPYALMMLIGSGICVYLAVDLYLLLAGYDRAPPRDYIFVVALAGLALVFAGAAWGFWYFPWTWARMTLGPSGIGLSVRGLGAFPEVHIAWEELSAISVMVLPRHASTLRFETGEGLTKTIRVAAFADGLDDVLSGLGHAAKGAGFALDGAPLAAPVLGGRRWRVVAHT